MIFYILLACVLYTLALAYFFMPSPYLEGSKFAKKNQSVAILVLGDIGRSPRMQYHAASLSKAGFTVQLIGYKGTQPHKSLLEDANIKYQFIPDVPQFLRDRPAWAFPLFGPLKVLHQLFFLFIILGYAIDPPAYLLVQNPPAIPSLVMAQLICKIRKSRLIIDWHNLGYSILGLRLGSAHPLVKVSKLYEMLFGRYAYAHLTVTDSMATYLKETIEAQGIVKSLHDRPPTQFKSISTAERLQFLKLLPETSTFNAATDKLLVSSTSWTADEDFQILLDGLIGYDAYASSLSSPNAAPRLFVVITGKGPLKDHYSPTIRRLSEELSHVVIKTVWLSSEDYPTFLACADLGISLHTSSSGLDLPMKVVDMFGCGVPVLAIHFACIYELVVDGLNGRTFHDSEDLTQCLTGLFTDGAGQAGEGHLATLREGAAKEGSRRWDDEWVQICGPIFVKRS